MSTNWTILNLKRNINDDLVTEITYQCRVTEGNNSQRKIGNISIDGDASHPEFIAFENLTEEIILSWLTDELTEVKMTEISKNLENDIAESIARRVAITSKRGTPWDGKNSRPTQP